MTTGTIITKVGRVIAMNRTFKGVPDYLAPDQFKVGTGNSTPIASQTDLDTPVIISGISYVKDVASGYPLFDETNVQATNRFILLSTEANGNILTEFGSFNKDSPFKMFSRSVFDAISKDSTVQIVFVEKDMVI